MVPHSRITVKGALEQSWSAWFDDLTLGAVEYRAAASAACLSGQPDDP